jgi:hypothetical protein
MNPVSDTVPLIHRSDSIRQVRDVDGAFRVAFCGHASWYRTAAPALQQILREAYAAKREVSFSTSADCEIYAVAMLPPPSSWRRISDQLERLTDFLTRRNTRWWRDSRRAARKANREAGT